MGSITVAVAPVAVTAVAVTAVAVPVVAAAVARVAFPTTPMVPIAVPAIAVPRVPVRRHSVARPRTRSESAGWKTATKCSRSGKPGTGTKLRDGKNRVLYTRGAKLRPALCSYTVCTVRLGACAAAVRMCE